MDAFSYDPSVGPQTARDNRAYKGDYKGNIMGRGRELGRTGRETEWKSEGNIKGI